MGALGRGDAPIPALLEAIGDPRAVPDLAWVAALTGEAPEAVQTAIEGLARHIDDVASIRAAHLSGGREFYAQICAPFELYALARILRPAHIVEAGVSSGVSSSHFLLGLLDNGVGSLHSIDLPTPQKGPKLARGESPVSLPPDRAPGWAVPSELSLGWDLRIGRSEALLPPLVESLPSVDLFLHDDLHTPTHLAFELATIRPKLRPGAVVLADNTQWTGKAFDRFAASLGVPIVRRRDSDLVGLRVPDSPPPAPARRTVPRPTLRARRPPTRPATRGRRSRVPRDF
ncbi:MAG TPA: class I SAM-dependent methyltransferase [Thermoplasmata archaeon]|nr:class I SAM-dependent methyltransferase [Thermoplasmata archaeon]